MRQDHNGGATSPTGTITDVPIIFQTALKANASGIIICQLKDIIALPMSAFYKLKRQAAKAGRLDHI
jgi:hypothetical protein